MLLARHANRVLVPLRSCPRKRASTTGSPLEPVPAKAGTGMSGACRNDSLVKQQRAPACRLAKRRASSPAFFVEAPGRPVSRLVSHPRQSEGDGAPSDATICSLSARVPSRKHGGASRRATRTSSRRPGLFAGVLLTAPSRAFRWPFQLETDHPSAKLLAGGSCWPPDGVPVPPGCVLARHARGRRIPAPPSDASR